MRTTVLFTFCIITPVLTTSCQTVTRSNEVTLDKALSSVATGLQNMRQQTKSDPLGLLVDEATVVFKLSAKGTNEGGIAVDLSPTEAVSKAGGSAKASYEGYRENTITIKFKNVLMTDPKSTQIKDLETLEKIIHYIRDHSGAGIILRNPPSADVKMEVKPTDTR